MTEPVSALASNTTSNPHETHYANESLVPTEQLERLVEELFLGVGTPDKEAALMARILVDADLRGVHSHGTRFVSTYLKAIRDGKTRAKAELTMLADGGSTVLIDANASLGHIVAQGAMALAIERARLHGTGTVSVRNSTHCGALAYYTQQAADSGMLGYASTNAGMAMIPTGGIEKVCGLNPLSWAAPTDREWAFNLDMATSVVAGSKLLLAKERGEKIPFGWAIGPDGQPTDDPEKGFAGGLLPIAGPKGYGLSVMLDVLTGVLSGGRFGRELGGPGCAHFFQAVDIERFMPLANFRARMGELIDQIKGSKLEPGSEGIFMPGEIEYGRKAERRKSGVPLTNPTIAALNAEAEGAGLPTLGAIDSVV